MTIHHNYGGLANLNSCSAWVLCYSIVYLFMMQKVRLRATKERWNGEI